MDVIEAINTRKSVRAYKPTPVPQEVLRQVLQVSQRAPSWENTQPWEIAVVGGEVMSQLKQSLMEAAEKEEAAIEIPEPRWPDVHLARRRAIGYKIYEIKGIAREDREKRRWWGLLGVRFFEAPNGIIVYTDRALNTWSIFDCNALVTNITLAALNFGLGTTVEISPVRYSQAVRRVLGIPESKILVIALAIGYPDMSDPINQFRSEREPLEAVAQWHGFD